jgi:primosomal protein N' (replication factor Y) (superfamily II helicase)
MGYYEVLVADGKFHGDKPLTYSYEGDLTIGSVVAVPLRNRMITAFVSAKVKKPVFATKPIKNLISQQPLPAHCLELARWVSDYYACNYGDALRQFAPSRPTLRAGKEKVLEVKADNADLKLILGSPLTGDQKKALASIQKSKNTTVLLHGDTGTGKTRVYLELAKKTLEDKRSVIILTPEIALTAQLTAAAKSYLSAEALVIHSNLGVAARKKLWLKILEAKEPVVIIGPRSALFVPLAKPGLIIVDEAHEPAYKQDQTPRYHAGRVASQLGALTKARVILGTATPSLGDYYVAEHRGAIVRMTEPAISHKHGKTACQVVDIKDRNNFSKNPYLSNQLIDAINTTLSDKKQIMIYLNRRGSARVILCSKCGWHLLCPNCDIPLVYHGDEHIARCHTCGHSQAPPIACPECKNTDIIYKSIGTKALAESVGRLFPEARVQRFDSDNLAGETINELYAEVHSGMVDILVGTQLLAKGFDLPKLSLVGIVTAEASLSMPDFTAEERTFQLLYQVMGRVGRGHSAGQVVVQSYEPKSFIIQTATARDYKKFYDKALLERQQFRFPPFAYLLKLSVRRKTLSGAESAAEKLKSQLQALGLPVEIIGPTPSFYGRRGDNYYWQLVARAKNRKDLVMLTQSTPADWMIDLDPSDLL